MNIRPCAPRAPLTLALVVLGALSACASRGVVEPGVTTDLGGTTLRNPPPQTVTVTEQNLGTWSATGAGPVKASKVDMNGVTHVGNGVTRQLFLQTGDTVFALGSETDIRARGLRVLDPSGDKVLLEAEEFGTSSAAPIEAHAKALDALRPIVEAWVMGQRDVALAELEAQSDAIDAAVPGLVDLLKRTLLP
ncbi:MAG: hypothetical protein AB7O32_00190 [Vicinamibacterales bacterium]